VLVATLVQASMLVLVLILTPLLWLGDHRPQTAALARWRIALYFLAIGFAFLFVEIASIQRFVLFLGHPVYAIPVVLCAFLFFAGLDSGFAPRLTARLDALQGLSTPGALLRGGDGSCRWVVRVRHAELALAVAGIVAAAVLHLVAAPSLFRWLMPLPDTLKIAVSFLHGPAISLGSRPRCRGSARARALGMGHQRLCLRVERDTSDPASDEPGI
jgi:hypothetical protein